MNEEHCPNCHRHCGKEHLHCQRGYNHFGLQTPSAGTDLTGLLVQLEKQFKASDDKSKFFNCLTDCERKILITILQKIKSQNEKK